MSKSLVGRRGGKRIILWGRVWLRGAEAAPVALVVFLVLTCVFGASADTPFFETWWGRHLLVLLIGFLTLAVAVGALLPVLRSLHTPLDRLPDFDPALATAIAAEHTGLRLSRRRVVLLVGIVAIPLLFVLLYAEEDWRGERAWNQYLRQQEPRGETFDPAAVVPPPVRDDENFAMTPFFGYMPRSRRPGNSSSTPPNQDVSPLYESASSQLKLTKVTPCNSWVSADTDLLAWHKAFVQATDPDSREKEAARAFQRRYGLSSSQAVAAVALQRPTNSVPVSTNVPTLAEAAATVLAGLADAEPVLEELRAASRRPYSRFNLNYDSENPSLIMLPYYGPLKSVCQVLQLRASAELALGRTEAALADISLIFQLTDATRTEPFLISHLVRISQLHIGLQPLAEGLARHQWSEPQLLALEERLRQFDFLADGRRALQGERLFFGNGMIDYVRRASNRWNVLDNIVGAGGSGTGSGFSWPSAMLFVAPRGWFSLEKLNYNRMFEDYFLPAINVPGHRVSPEQCRKISAHLDAVFKYPAPTLVLRHRFLSSFLLPAVTGSIQKFAFAQSGTDAAGVACALERYRLARGQFPENLDALVPQFITQLPPDVISGQPLKYRRSSDGRYVLYSVGWNQTDDGGMLGLSQSGQTLDRSAGDWVWRLPSS